MAEKGDIEAALDKLSKGALVNIQLMDGTEVAGKFQGVDGDQIQIDGADQPVKVDTVEMVLLAIHFPDGPE